MSGYKVPSNCEARRKTCGYKIPSHSKATRIIIEKCLITKNKIHLCNHSLMKYVEKLSRMRLININKRQKLKHIILYAMNSEFFMMDMVQMTGFTAVQVAVIQ